MSNDKNKSPKNRAKKSERYRDSNTGNKPQSKGGFIGDSQKQQDSLRKAAEAPPRVPKKTKGTGDNNNNGK